MSRSKYTIVFYGYKKHFIMNCKRTLKSTIRTAFKYAIKEHLVFIIKKYKKP